MSYSCHINDYSVIALYAVTASVTKLEQQNFCSYIVTTMYFWEKLLINATKS